MKKSISTNKNTRLLAHLLLQSNEDGPDPAPDISDTEATDNELANSTQNNVRILVVNNSTNNGSSS